MRYSCVVLLLGVAALALAGPTSHEGPHADKEFLEHQKEIFKLFWHVNQPSYFPEHVEIAKTWKIEDHYDYFTKPEVAKYFWKYYNSGYLPKGEIFSVFHEEHQKQAIAIFKVFYYAKDWDTFYKTAVWARQHVNEGIFVYAFSVAVTHRPDCYGYVIPPIYEVYPHYFFPTETIEKAHKYKQVYPYYDKQHEHEHAEQHDDKEWYTVHSNYSGHYLNLHPEQSMSYFTEDVGINAFYYYYNIYYPFWMSAEDFDFSKDKRGEQYYYIHQQIIARYYLERLSNGFGEIEWYNWEVPFETGYYPSMRYPNGMEFPSRPHHAKLYEYFYNYGQKFSFRNKYGYSYTAVQDYERRIRDAIDKGYVYSHDGKVVNIYGEDGFNTIGNIIECNGDSPNRRYYGNIQSYARHLLGYSYQPYDWHKVAPSALEHFETCMRDPAFYQFYKRIVTYFQMYKQYVKPYAKDDIYFHGAEIKKVEMERIITYFEYYDSDISNAMYVTPEEYKDAPKVQVKARQYRLNHKPFTYKIHVNSDKEQEVVVRVYIGPKYDEYGRYINITENRVNFVFFDKFKYNVKSGENVIERNSYENKYYKKDRTSYRDIYKAVMRAIQGQEEYKYGDEAYYGFPMRYMVPKGNYNGQEYQFYFIVSPYVPYKYATHAHDDHHHHTYPQVGTGEQYIDNYPVGYPFDRPIHHEKYFCDAPNSYFYTTKIYHRNAEDVNSVHAHHH